LAGIVTARHTNSGEVAGEAPLFEVADYSQVRVDLSVFPRDRVRLKSGQTVHVIAADGASTADGKIAYIAPAGTAQVIVARVALSNKDGRWTAGQFVTGEVVVDETQAGIVVLPSALQQMKGQTVVFVQHGDNIEARTIDIGKRTSDAIEVKSGLEVGEQYVVDNSYLVKAELMKSEAEEE
jgi:cobalt-zinc-cadmium efflux system membrane fusion protein